MEGGAFPPGHPNLNRAAASRDCTRAPAPGHTHARDAEIQSLNLILSHWILHSTVVGVAMRFGASPRVLGRQFLSSTVEFN